MKFYQLLKLLFQVMRLRYRFEVCGEENLPKDGKCTLASNHLKWSDSFLLQLRLPMPVAYVAKKELFEHPFAGKAMRRAHQISIDRDLEGKMSSSQMRQLRDELRFQAINRTNLGMAIGVFPEGTRSKDGKLGLTRDGVLLIAEATGRPLIPIGIVYIPRKLVSWRPRFRETFRIAIGKPVSTKGRARDVSALLRREISLLSGQELATKP